MAHLAGSRTDLYNFARAVRRAVDDLSRICGLWHLPSGIYLRDAWILADRYRRLLPCNRASENPRL